MGELFFLLIVVGGFYLFNKYVLTSPKERELKSKGYRERYTYFGGPTYFEPDPTKRGTIPDETWKNWGYRWSEKYHRWYKPKKTNQKYK